MAHSDSANAPLGLMDDSEILGAIYGVRQDLNYCFPPTHPRHGSCFSDSLELPHRLHRSVGRRGVARQYLPVPSCPILLR